MIAPAREWTRGLRVRGRTRGAAVLARDYVGLTRPGVLALVLLTAPPGLRLGSQGWPPASIVLGVLLGAALVGAGCSALNAWYERDRDARMLRTQDRPLPAGRVAPSHALAMGGVCSGLGLLILLGSGGWLAALVAAATLLHYLLVYTVWLKPVSSLSTVLGSLSGATAPLIADAAVDGRIGPWGLVLFGMIVLWQPPHVWAIALYRKTEYQAAGFPMLPSAIGDRSTRRWMLAFALLLLPLTLVPWLGGVLGPVYGVTALAGGLSFVWSIARAMRAQTPSQDRRVFTTSLVHLTALFAVMLAELILR